MEELFYEKKVDQFSIFQKNGKIVLNCIVKEKWENIFDLSLSCGNKWQKRLKRSIGIGKTDKESLEAMISGSLGMKGVAELGSSVKATSGVEYRFDTLYEEEETFLFEAPKCGKLRVLIYQLTRVFEFDYINTTWLHGDQWKRKITEWLPIVRDESKSIDNDPSCGCDIAERIGLDGMLFVAIDKIKLFESYIRQGENVLLKRLGQTIQVDFNVWPYEFSLEIPKSAVPEHLLFLAQEESEELHAHFTPIDILAGMNALELETQIY